MKIVLELKEGIKLNDNDILIYRKGKVDKISKSSLLREEHDENNNRISDIKRLEDYIKMLDKRIYDLELKDKLNSGIISEEEYELCLGNK